MLTPLSSNGLNPAEKGIKPVDLVAGVGAMIFEEWLIAKMGVFE